ncbi:MAG: CPBP family intramembrane metalloprotease [Candidatus Marinimicrobia bacterium]|nr:CPBP family intramembrane metalloprotease [Candidatus Neomarinimicrobiota bacterium]
MISNISFRLVSLEFCFGSLDRSCWRYIPFKKMDTIIGNKLNNKNYKYLFYLFIIFLLLINKFKIKNYQVNLFSINDILIGLISGIIVFYLSIIISKILKNISIIYRNRNNHYVAKNNLFNKIKHKPLILILIVFLVILEEIVFRVVLLNKLNIRFGSSSSIFISSFLFAFFHFNIYKFFQLLTMGIIFCLILKYTTNIITPIIAHSINNFLVIHFLKNKTFKDSNNILMYKMI